MEAGAVAAEVGVTAARAAVTVVVVDMATGATVVTVTVEVGVVHATPREAALSVETRGIRVRFLSVGASY